MAHKQQRLASAGKVSITATSASSVSGRPSNAVGRWQKREEASTFVLSRYRYAELTDLSLLTISLHRPATNVCCAPPPPRASSGYQQASTRDHQTVYQISAKRRARRRRFFWWGAVWQEFLKPTPGGIAFARQTPACKAGVAALLPRPGVYEFALTKGPASQRCARAAGQCT